MKVRISQAVSLEEVPDKLSEIIHEIKHDYEDMEVRIQDCIAASSLTSSSSIKYRLLMENILEMRSDLSQLDQTLSDLASILEGYIGILEKDAAPPLEPQVPQFSSPPTTPEADPREVKDAD